MTLIPASGESNVTTGIDGNKSTTNTEFTDTSLPASKSLAYVIPIKDQIGPPILDILRRGLKDAIRENAQIVILDMDTPGGELGVTLEIMEEIIESLEKFEGKIFGEIVWPGRGKKGHGYDPVFLPNGYEETFGQMDRWKKNKISHRGLAMDSLLKACF